MTQTFCVCIPTGLHQTSFRIEPTSDLTYVSVRRAIPRKRNYGIFWKTFAEQYPFFSLHKTDWHAVDKKFRPLVGANTKPTELFGIFRQMIEPLWDTHTALEADDIKVEFDGWRDDPNHLDENGWKKAFSIIESKYAPRGLRAYCNGHLQFGRLTSAIGYLRVTTFYGYSDEGGYANQLQCLQQSLDLMFGSGEKLNGLVIDVRLNAGGDDPLGIEIASRLTAKKYLAYSKAARCNRDLDVSVQFTVEQPTWVVPSTRPGFTGKIALLIGPDTVSAGETFAMALMAENLT